ncbi:MAG: hypothetical protein F6K31_13355 [Symploca sp. SIO2G7]|nr:hypothetical protein [Symploca sp. SIO2G7]
MTIFNLITKSLVIGHWSLVIGHLSLVIGHYSPLAHLKVKYTIYRV